MSEPPSPEGIQRTCTKCRETKLLADFSARSNGRPHSWCRRCTSTYSRNWQTQNPEKVRRYALKAKFGLTLEEVEQMVLKQGGTCPGCSRPLPSGRGRHVDHDHATGEVRGLLCSNCNMVLGLVHDDPEWLRRLAGYLN